MARLRYNALKTGSAGAGVALALGASLTSSATSITFNAALTHSNGTAVPTITGSDYIPLELLDSSGNMTEIVYLTAYTAGAATGTITRGQEGTTGVAHSSGDKIVHGTTVADIGGCIAATSYNPGTLTSYNIASSTVTDVDATNLAVTFTAPVSGAVTVTLSTIYTPPGTNSNYLTWHLRESTTTVASKYVGGTTNVDNLSATVVFHITGLTPGSSHTYKWAHSRTGTGTGTTHAGGLAGAAVMKVDAVN